jgi:hypothetical protein
MDRDEIINRYRRLSIDASYQVSIHFAERFQRRSFIKIDQSETRIACGGHFFQTDYDKMSKLYKRPSIDASYQVSVYFAERLQRRSFLKIDQSETRIVCGDHAC